MGVLFKEMTREQFLLRIVTERNYQTDRWGDDFDDKNTVNDWANFISRYANYATTGERDFHDAMVKVAAIALAAVEAYNRNEGLAPRHYDKGDRFVE